MEELGLYRKHFVNAPSTVFGVPQMLDTTSFGREAVQ